MAWRVADMGGTGWWTASPPEMQSVIAARAAAGMEFLRQYSGPDSAWTQRAESVYNNKGGNRSDESGARALGDFLRSWADQVEAGVIEVFGSAASGVAAFVSTDMMEQVRQLLADKTIHPAAPIVLSGAALEVALRAAVEAHALCLSARPSISAYATALRSADLISKQDVKDIESCGGMRNAAAHGEFEALSAERAGTMEGMTNMLLRRLSEQAPAAAVVNELNSTRP